MKQRQSESRAAVAQASGCQFHALCGWTQYPRRHYCIAYWLLQFLVTWWERFRPEEALRLLLLNRRCCNSVYLSNSEDSSTVRSPSRHHQQLSSQTSNWNLSEDGWLLPTNLCKHARPGIMPRSKPCAGLLSCCIISRPHTFCPDILAPCYIFRENMV